MKTITIKALLYPPMSRMLVGGTGSLPAFAQEKDLKIPKEIVFSKDSRLNIRLGPNSPVCELTLGKDCLKAVGHMRNCTQGYIDQLIADGWVILPDGFKQAELPVDETICTTPGCLAGIPKSGAYEGVDVCDNCALIGQLRMADRIAAAAAEDNGEWNNGE